MRLRLAYLLAVHQEGGRTLNSNVELILFHVRHYFHFDLLGLTVHETKQFKKIFRLDVVRWLRFGYRVVDDSNCLSAHCVKFWHW